VWGLNFEGNKVKTIVRGKVEVIDLNFTIDTAKTPYTITFIHSEALDQFPPLKGIFKLESTKDGDTLTLCTGNPRPAMFSTKGHLGDVLLKLVRVEPKEDGPGDPPPPKPDKPGQPPAPPSAVADGWQTTAVKPPLDKKDGKIDRLVFTPDGKRLLTLQQRKFTLWQLEPQKPLAFVDHVNETTWTGFAGVTTDGAVWLLKPHQQDKFGTVTAITLMNLETGQKKGNFPISPASLFTLSPDGKYLAQASFDKPHYNKVILWDAASGQQVAVLPGAHTGGLHSLAFTADSKLLVAAGIPSYKGHDAFVTAWDVAQKTERFTLPELADILGFSLSADGKFLAADHYVHANKFTSPDPQWEGVRITNLVTGTAVNTLNVWPAYIIGKHVHTLTALAPDGRLLATCNGNAANPLPVFLWDVTLGKQVDTLPTANQVVTALTFGPAGQRLACGDDQGQVTIWEKK
jgi:uncharacterized protein (TIGR03067 family)